MKPKEIPFAPQTYTDRFTKRRVTRLFPSSQPACHAYFTGTSYDNDGRLILTAHVDGRVQLCRVAMRAGTLHQLTDLPDVPLQTYCIVPSKNLALIVAKDRLVRVNLETGENETIFTAAEGWSLALPSADHAGKRAAFVMKQNAPNRTETSRIYSAMPENFYMRPHCMIFTIDLESNTPSCIWGESEWISHVLINPVDPDTIVFCHEGGGLADHRLWVVGAKLTRKKHAKCLYVERFEDFLIHEYFCRDGALGVQLTEYDPSDAQVYGSKTLFNGALFLDMQGRTVAKWKLPGRRSGHIQSNSINTLLVSDGYHPTPEFDYTEGQHSLALHRPDEQGNLSVERLCYSGTSWKTQASHPHPIFSPDDKQVLFSAETEGVNSVYVIDI